MYNITTDQKCSHREPTTEIRKTVRLSNDQRTKYQFHYNQNAPNNITNAKGAANNLKFN